MALFSCFRVFGGKMIFCGKSEARFLIKKENKAVYTTASVAYGWAGVVKRKPVKKK